jgi:hypothetical protein
MYGNLSFLFNDGNFPGKGLPLCDEVDDLFVDLGYLRPYFLNTHRNVHRRKK